MGGIQTPFNVTEQKQDYRDFRFYTAHLEGTSCCGAAMSL